MAKIRNMKVEDVEIVAKMVALDYNSNLKEGYREAREHALGHLKIVPQHCYIVENDDKQVIATMILHPQEKIFEIEDFHIKDIHQNKETLVLLKMKLLNYLEDVDTEILCCPYAFRRLIKTS